MRPRVDIPLRDPAPEAETQEKLFNRGRFLARQEAWDDLGREICGADAERHLTPGLTPVAMWLARGARYDAVSAAKHAIAKGEERGARAALAALEVNLEDMPDCPALAFVLTMANLDLASAWRARTPLAKLPPARKHAYDAHMQAASAFVEAHDPFEYDSALWAYARCAVIGNDACAMQRAADDYEDLIDLDPRCILHPQALGRDLLPRRFGSYEALEVQARRTANRTKDVWGAGGYTLVYIGALERDPGAMLRLDAELFCEGLHDILARHPNQHIVNRFAAFCGLTMSGKVVPGSTRARLADCFGWISADHLRELHPRIWADAPLPSGESVQTEDSDTIRRGMTRAISALAECYAPRIAAGERLVFTPKGLTFQRGG